MSTFLLIFIISSFSYAQIIIEERVEVNLTPPIVLKPLAQHLIRIELQWTPANIPAAILIYDEAGQYPCRITGGSDWQNTGFVSYQQEDVLGGHYSLQFRSDGPCFPPNTIDAQYFIYYDNNLLKSGSFTLSGCYSGGSYPYYNEIFITPLKTDYSFNIYPANLCMGKGTTPGFSLERGCTNVEIDTTTEMVNLQILSGGEYTSFYGYQGMVTDNLTVPYSELNTIQLKQDQFFSGSETTVLVRSNLSGIIKQDSIIAYPKSSYGITASPVLYPIFYGQTIVREVRQYGPGDCSAIFPADIKLNAVITEGNESGHLKDFNNSTTGDTLTNITFRSFGGNLIGFVSDGIKKDIADTVIVTFSTTDPEINTVQLSIIINPDPLYVAIEPDPLAPGETATVTIKSRLEDGTLEDFPPERTFEVGMLEGCTLGNIIADGDTAQYFYDVMQPITFLADSLAEGGGTVKLIVGLVEEFIPFRPVSENEIISDEKAFKEKETEILSENENTNVKKEYKVVAEGNNTGGNGIIPDNPTENFCFLDPIQSFTTQEAEFVVGDECEEISTDHSAIIYSLQEQPEFFKVPHSDFEELKLVELIQVCNDDAYPNQQGGSITVDYKRYRYDYTTNSFKNSWVLKPYKGTDDRVHYYFVNQQFNEATPLLFDFVTGICYLKINPPGHPPNTLIENISDVDDDSKIPSDDYDQAFFDFCGHLCYRTEKATYVLIEILEIHEREHMRDYENIVTVNFPALVGEIESYSNLCQSYSEEVRENAEKVVYTMIDKFIRDAKKQYDVISNNPTKLDHELQIQGRESITNRIGDYKEALVSRFITQLIGKNCQKCSYQ